MIIQLSKNGPEVSRVTFGMMRLLEDPEGASVDRIRQKIEACLEMGVFTFDHADIYGGYGCEEAFGQVLAAEPSLRDKMTLVTKCGIALLSEARPSHRVKHYNYSADHIVSSVERSLKNLNTDRIEVLLMHRPSPLMNPDEVAETLLKLKEQGKVLHFGVSNFTPTQWDMLASRLELVSNQIEISPLHLDPFLDGTLDQCLENKVVPMAWSPLAGGRVFNPQNEREQRLQTKLKEMAEKYQTSVDGLVYSWLFQHPSQMVAVTGTNKIERVKTAVNALELKLDIQDWFDIWSVSTGEEVP